MKICGLQKVTLLDYPGHVACTVFLGGCDYRCPFCHNYDLACGRAPAALDEEELFRCLEKRRGVLDGVAVTGGEPCLQSALPDLLRRIRQTGYAVKLDTNGAHPDMLEKLIREGLVDYVAMDVKNSPEKYARTVGLADVSLEGVRESVRILMRGEADHEFRTTVVRELHEPEDMHAMGRWLRGARRWFLQPFVDRDTVPFEGLHAPDKEQLDAFLAIMREYVPESEIRGLDA
ncbi:MAG: anaerobic ribonucleoside-triphosphate reductase activating protein [Clostridia bacterium]|nr:anaerobic ribonucleoside-triphosphate reductase activating protein [Clostridia bacterium]